MMSIKKPLHTLFATLIALGVVSGSLQAIPDATYRQSLTGYMGYRAFSGSHDVASTFEGGALFTHRFNTEWTLEAKLGVLPSWSDKTGGGTQFRTIYPYELGVSHPLSKEWYTLLPYWRVGVNGDFSNYYGTNMAIYGGVGALYPLGRRTFMRADFAWGRTFAIEVGFGKSFRAFWDDDPEPEIVKPAPAPVVEPKIPVVPAPAPVLAPVVPTPPVKPEKPLFASSNVSAPSYLYTFTGTIPEFVDAPDHWALPSLRRTSLLGLLSIENGKIYPNEGVTLSDMSAMVVKATYLHKILDKMAIRIASTVEGVPSESYTVDLKIKDASGNEVRTLVSGERRRPGALDVVWDGTDGVVPVNPGKYGAYLTVSRGGKTLSESHTTIEALPFKAIGLVGNGKSVGFSEKYESDWARKVIQNFTNLGYVDANLGKQFRGAGKPVSKIDFIVAVSKALTQLGATRPSQPIDWTFYRDKDSIPSYAIGNLEIYVNAFGFGGSRGTSTLDSSKKITRAEAAEILNRLLNWNIQNVGVLPTSGGQASLKKPDLSGPVKSVSGKSTKTKKSIKKGKVTQKTVKKSPVSSKPAPKKSVQGVPAKKVATKR